MMVESIVFQANNENYRYINKQGYYLAAAINGDWDARQFYITGIAHQHGDNLVFFDKAITGSTRINCIWVKLFYEI